MLNLRPAWRLRERAAVSKKKLRDIYACVHLRTEDDFKKYQSNRPPGYYSMEQIVEKLRRTILAYPQIFAGIEDVYVTGNHNSSESSSVDAAFKTLFRRVHTKQTLLLETNLSYTEAAVVDQTVCEHAKVFVGNNHSAWSQQVYYVRFLMSMFSNFQYNSIEPDEKIESVMHGFCTWFDPEFYGLPCKYYRVQW
jgi:hypothetical protein